MKKDIETVLSHVNWVQSNIELTRWKPNEYDQLGHRTLQQLLQSRQTSYMNPCLDLTAILMLRLREAGFKPVLLVQELKGSHTGGPVLHFATEVQLGRQWHTIDFKTGKKALLYTGQYDLAKSNPENQHLALTRFSTDQLKPQTTPLQLMGLASWRQMGRIFHHMKYRDVLQVGEAMKKSDNQRLFQKIRRIRPRILRL